MSVHTMEKEKLLLHTCCAPCITYVSSLLTDTYNVKVYFYNPNIYPQEEYERRKNELINFVSIQNLSLEIEPPDFETWYELIKGLENEPEQGARCWKCYQIRLKKTAQHAKENNYDLFTTSLSVSPHKNAAKINEIGSQLAQKTGVKFLEADFKKNDGFKKSCELSYKFNLYRQKYCGCKYSYRT